MATQSAFFESALDRLSQRDLVIQHYLTELTENYNSLYLKNRKLEDENESLRKDNLIFKQSNSDPHALNNLRETNSDLQRRITQNYEDYKKVQDNLLSKIEDVQGLTEKSGQLGKDNKILKEKVNSLEKNLKMKETNLAEMGEELANVTKDRNQLLSLKDGLQTEVTNLKNENNQLIQRMLVDKQNMIEEWNEINKEREIALRKVKELEEERKKFEDMKKKFLQSASNRKDSSANEENPFETVDLKVFYTGQKSEATKIAPVKKIQLHTSEIYSIAESYMGDLIATCGGDGYIKLYDPSRNNPYLSLKPQSGNQIPTAVSFGFDNDNFLSGTADKMVYLWSLSTQRVKKTFVGHGDRISTVCFIRDMSRIVSGSHDRSMKIWDAVKGSISKTILCGSSCNSLLATSDKTRIISGHYDGSVRVYSTKTGEIIKAYKNLHEGSVTSVTLDLEGNILLTGSKDNTSKMIDLRMERVLPYEFKHSDYYNPCDYNKVTFCNYGHSVVAGGSDSKIYIWNSETGKSQHVLEGGNQGLITGCCYNVSSGHLYTVDNNGYAVVWS